MEDSISISLSKWVVFINKYTNICDAIGSWVLKGIVVVEGVSTPYQSGLCLQMHLWCYRVMVVGGLDSVSISISIWIVFAGKYTFYDVVGPCWLKRESFLYPSPCPSELYSRFGGVALDLLTLLWRLWSTLTVDPEMVKSTIGKVCFIVLMVLSIMMNV